jgi:hypothetical protein
MSDFTTVFQDDFNGSQLDWGIWRTQYSGQYGNGMFRWDPGQIEVGDGRLTIATERDGGSWVSGGLSTIPDGISYGRVEFRARVDEGQGTSGIFLLWPSSNEWTDEIDIVETNDPSRDSFAFVNHGEPNTVDYIRTNVDEWHTYRLDWTPGELKLFVDDRHVSTLDVDVPSQQMSFSIQGHVHGDWERWYGGGPDGSTPDRVEIEVDWVRVSAWTPGEGNSAPEPRQAPAAAAWSDDGEWSAPADDGYDWMAAAQRYVENDGTWEGSWRNQVADGQITLEDVADRIRAGEGQWDFWN